MAQPAAATRPRVERGERVLTVADTIDGSVAASTRALYHRRGDQPDGWVRIGWEQIETARWRPADQTLTLTALPGNERPPISFHLNEPGQLPAVCQDRIAATVIATRRVTLASSPAVITVRRQPGTDALVWTVRLRERTQADTDRQVDHAIRALRADLGI
jgi:hypothetical protein